MQADRHTERDLSRLLAGQMISVLGSMSSTFCLAFTIFRETGSVPLMVTFQFLNWAPTYWLGPLTGIIVDRFGARTVLLVSNIIGIAVTISVAAGCAVDKAPVAVLLLAAFVLASVSSFIETAISAIVPAFTQSARLQVINGRLAAAQSIICTAAPALGAVFMTLSSLSMIFIFDALTFLAALLLVRAVPEDLVSPVRGHDSIQSQFMHGIRWIYERPALRWLCIFFAFGTAFNGLASGLVTAYVLMRSGNNAFSQAITNIALMVGVFVGGMVASRLLRRWPHIALVAGGSFASALGRIGLGLGPSVAVWATAQACRGVGATIASTTSTSLFQELAPAEMRGRILGTQRAFNGCLLPLAILAGGAIGTAASTHGPQALGLCFVVYGLLEMSTLPLLLRVRSLSNVQSTSEQTSALGLP